MLFKAKINHVYAADIIVYCYNNPNQASGTRSSPKIPQCSNELSIGVITSVPLFISILPCNHLLLILKLFF
jgi:hypothetical protein